MTHALIGAGLSLGLVHPNPNLSSFEVFGTFFRLIGTNLQFILQGVFLITALFLKRPWCAMLCPLRPVTDFIRMGGVRLREMFGRSKSPAIEI